MQFQPISFEEYNKIRKFLLVGSEAIKEEVYRDIEANKKGIEYGNELRMRYKGAKS